LFDSAERQIIYEVTPIVMEFDFFVGLLYSDEIQPLSLQLKKSLKFGNKIFILGC